MTTSASKKFFNFNCILNSKKRFDREGYLGTMTEVSSTINRDGTLIITLIKDLPRKYNT